STTGQHGLCSKAFSGWDVYGVFGPSYKKSLTSLTSCSISSDKASFNGNKTSLAPSQVPLCIANDLSMKFPELEPVRSGKFSGTSNTADIMPNICWRLSCKRP